MAYILASNSHKISDEQGANDATPEIMKRDIVAFPVDRKLGGRFQNTKLGEWGRPDPAQYIDGMNLYQMEIDNPVGLVDPEGYSGRKTKPAPQPGGSQGLGRPRDPNAHPTPGDETGVVIMADLGWMNNALWRLKYNQYVNDVLKGGKKCQCYPHSVTAQQLGDILRNPNVTDITIIGHGADGDGFGIIWLDDKTGILASDIKGVIGKSKDIQKVTLRACFQGAPKSRADWQKAFNISPSQFSGPTGDDRWWYNNPTPPPSAQPPAPAKPKAPTTQAG